MRLGVPDFMALSVGVYKPKSWPVPGRIRLLGPAPVSVRRRADGGVVPPRVEMA
jgi:hypothetical protein